MLLCMLFVICLCDVVWFACCDLFVIMWACMFNVFACFVCGLQRDGVWCGVICFVCLCVLCLREMYCEMLYGVVCVCFFLSAFVSLFV